MFVGRQPDRRSGFKHSCLLGSVYEAGAILWVSRHAPILDSTCTSRRLCAATRAVTLDPKST